MSRPPLLLLVLLAGFLGARPAWAGERIVVLDRGRGAAAEAARWRRIAEGIAAAGGATLVLYGTREDGRPRIAAVAGDLDDALSGDEPGRPGWAFEGPTDPRQPLELFARRASASSPMDVFLVGPFAGAGDTSATWGRVWADAWRDRHPAGSRILPIGLAKEARAALEGWDGLVGAGWVVYGLDRVETTPEPYSPFEPDAPRRARVDLYLGAQPVGPGPEGPPFVPRVRGDGDEAGATMEDGHLVVRLVRHGTRREPFHLSFEAPDDARAVLLVDPPPSVDVPAGVLGEHARLEGADGGPPAPFRALGVRADAPVTTTYTLLVSATGTLPEWRAHGLEAPLPDGLDIAFGPPTASGADVRVRRVDVRFAARPAHPVDAAGTVVITDAAGRYAFRLPYRVQVPPGRVRVRLIAPEARQPLPWGGDAPWHLRVEGLDPNAPPQVRIAWRITPEALAPALRVNDTVDAAMEVEVDREIPVRVARTGDGPGEDAVVEPVLLEQPGVTGTVEGRGRLRPRRPRLFVPAMPAPRYAVRGRRVEGDPPLRLVLDADGGDEAWRARLLGEAPSIEQPSDAPVRWRWEREDGPTWRLVAEGPWRGPAPDVFRTTRWPAPVAVSWPPGEAPDRIAVLVRLPARWGRVGWVLVALAALALVLGVVVGLHMRAPRLEGTLLYAIRGRSDTVGRLDLAAVGRGRKALRADRLDRLSLEGDGEVLGVVESTRVGGFLRLLPVAGEGAGSHLLVDGLTVETPRHRLRYVSPHPDDVRIDVPVEDVPDLLGPEYDLSGGRLGTLGPGGEPPTERAEADGDATRS